MRKFLLIAAVAATPFLFSSCSSDIEGNEKENPIYMKAMSDKNAGNYIEAAQSLNSLLAQAPNSALIHKELAALYMDNLKDPYRAVYHYNKYLELGKLGDDDKDAVNMYIENCKNDAATAQYHSNAALAKKLSGERPVVTSMPAAPAGADPVLLEKLKQQNEALKARFNKDKAEIARLKQQLGSAAASRPSASAPAAAPSAAAPAATGEYDTYVVQSGDNLTKIARKFYGAGKTSRKYLDIIKKANGMTSDNVNLGRTLKIPKLQSR